jgi:hypothetical protein
MTGGAALSVLKRPCRRPAGMEFLAGRPVGNVCSAATFPTDPHPAVEFVKINMPGKHQQTGRDEVLTSPHRAREPGTGDHPGALHADIVTALCDLAEMIN